VNEELDPPRDPETQRIGDMERLKAFLADEAVKRALAALNRQYFDDFKASTTPPERESAWAKARALDDFGTALQSILDVGLVAKHHREQREQQEDLARKKNAARQRR
jgi:Skp family chaperone for outer membrane proteins